MKVILFLTFQISPLIITCAANIWVLVICSRTINPVTGNSQLRKKSVVSILAVTTVFIVSSLPGALLMVMIIGNMEIDGKTREKMANISLHLSFVNVVSNFFIYKAVNNRYKEGRREMVPLSQSQQTSSRPRMCVVTQDTGLSKSRKCENVEEDIVLQNVSAKYSLD